MRSPNDLFWERRSGSRSGRLPNHPFGHLVWDLGLLWEPDNIWALLDVSKREADAIEVPKRQNFLENLGGGIY